MTASSNPGSTPDPVDRAELHSALFAQMVMQLANMAMMLLGKVPHPQSGETVRDIQSAGLLIDQLEMLEVKTRGNLTSDEQHFLKQNLMSLQMAFVEAVESGGAEPAGAGAGPAKPEPAASAAGGGSTEAGAATSTPPVEGESKKKFTKKY